jgi:hypothetical protein
VILHHIRRAASALATVAVSVSVGAQQASAGTETARLISVGLGLGGYLAPSPFPAGNTRALSVGYLWRGDRGFGGRISATASRHFATADDLSVCIFRADGSCWPYPSGPKHLWVFNFLASARVARGPLTILAGGGIGLPSRAMFGPGPEGTDDSSSTIPLVQYGGEVAIGQSRRAPVLQLLVTEFIGDLATVSALGTLSLEFRPWSR